MTDRRPPVVLVACLGVLLCWAQGCSNEQAPGPVDSSTKPPARVLFVGNSLTYYNNSLHNHLRRLMNSAPDSVLVPAEPRLRTMTISGGRLDEHAGLAAMLVAEPWDVVVLQGYSRGAYDGEVRRFQKAVRQHVRAIRAAGAEPLLFMTWAYADAPEMTDVIARNYSLLGAELKVAVAPVGLAFAAVTRDHPEIDLLMADRRHPELAGTYLAACVFYAVLYSEDPTGLDYTAGLDRRHATWLQQAAWKAVQGFRGVF